MLYQISCVDIKKGDLARFGNQEIALINWTKDLQEDLST